ncbi:putative berberine/berberine, FAD-binding domain, PCMH-type, FAD-binding, type PCMH, subdomain 2 [Septoria linicola]|nr:putative berberine/berberine, FAD-binding domain, PCMH-type, FAD-binding, type PCMH, subdomain 2 [Septoria linicola]
MAHPVQSELGQLKQICSSFYTPEQLQFREQAEPWSIWADGNPKLVVTPPNLPTLQGVIKFLYASSLDFAIRNTGTGGSSAKDVIISMHGFKTFDFDPFTEIATVGAGLAWGELDKLIEAKAPGYGVVGARCTWVGVTGAPLVGGLSWLSHEHGMISDPQNMIDAQVVLRDGRTVWAKQDGEYDLLRALRGGGGNFEGVSALKLHLKRVSSNLFGAIISVPYSSLTETSKAVAAMHRRPADPEVSMHVCNQGPGMGQPDQGARPNIAIMAMDFNGEAHARSDAGFAWAFALPGAIEVVAFEQTLQQINAMADSFKNYQGVNRFWCSAAMISDIDDETLIRAFKWYEDSYNLHPGFGVGSSVLLEFMQHAAFNSVESPTSTAWPHARGRRHVMQVLLGTAPEGAPDDVKDIAMKQFAKVGPEIGGKDAFHGEYHAGFLHEWNNLEEVYGENWERLLETKQKYDPENRFNKGIDLGRGKVTEAMTV